MTPHQRQITVLMPLRDDWLCAAELIRRIDRTVPAGVCSIELLLIDDGSVQRCDPADFQGVFSIVRKIRVLRLRRNLGHQRAIAIGLAHLQQSAPGGAVLVMDADGEDTAEGVVQLLDAFAEAGGKSAVFAERRRRTESLTFRFFYFLYRAVHRAMTGISVRVGNFSILPEAYLNTLAVMPEMWNHYAAAVLRSRLPLTMVPIPRGWRIAGKSSMNFVALVAHGLSAISVFGDIIGARVLIATLAGSLLAGLGIVAIVAERLFAHVAVPGWATYATTTLIVIIIQLLTIATSFTFFMLSNRTNLGFVPLRDYSLFVEELSEVYVNEAARKGPAPASIAR